MTAGKKRLPYILGVVVLVLLLLLFAGTSLVRRLRDTAASGTAMTATVERGDLAMVVSGSGVVEAYRKEVRAASAGTVAEAALEDGAEVESGQILVRLDLQDLTLQIERLRLDIQIQENDLEQLRREQTAAAVRSPGRGEITWKVAAGDRVQQDAVIAHVQERHRVEVRGLIDQSWIGHLQLGQEAEVRFSGPDIWLYGRVTGVGSIPRPGAGATVLYEVLVELDNPGWLDQGMTGQLTVRTSGGIVESAEGAVVSFPALLPVRAPIGGTIGPPRVNSGAKVEPGQALTDIANPDRARQLATQVQSAELRLRQARLDLQDREKQQAERAANSTVRAPIAGIVVLPQQKIEAGDQVMQGQLLATVMDHRRLHVVIPVDELDVAKVQPGHLVLLTADALPGVELTGRVRHVALQGRGQSGVATFDVTIDLDRADKLRVGMTVRAGIQADRREGVLLVPIEAVQYRDGKNFISVVEDRDARGLPRTRQVEVLTGAYDITRMEIVSGLQEGWEILIPGSSGTLPGGFAPPGGGMQREGGS